jgi:hypothetical protein
VTLTTEQAPRRKVAPTHLSTILVLALGAWVHPALSATGVDASCDESIDTPPMSAATDNKLAIRVIDHGRNTAVSNEEISLDETSADVAPESSDRRTGPRVDVMLRRIFDEARLRHPQLADPEQPDDMSAPIAVDTSEASEEPAAVISTDQTDGATELPGFSADELLRYRQQMFRKDI